MNLKLLKTTGASAIALAAATLGASAGLAADDQAILDAISLQTQHDQLVIRVATSDGARWDSIVEDTLQFNARMIVDTAGNGVIHDFGITLGACAGLSCQGAPVILSEAMLKRDLDREASLDFSTTLIPVSTPEEKASIPLGDQLLSRCNEKLTVAGAVASHAFNHDVPVTLVADTARTDAPLAAFDPAPNQTADAVAHADFARTSALKVKVVCDAGDGLADELITGGEDVVADGGDVFPIVPNPGVIDPPVADPDLPVPPDVEEPPFDPGFPVPPVGPVPHPLKVTGHLALKEYPNFDQTKPRLGRGIFRIYTNKPGPTKWRLNCTGGRQWIGTSPTVKIGFKKWRAIKTVNFQIDKTELVKCKLRTRSKPGHPVIAKAKRLYKVLPGDIVNPGAPLVLTGNIALKEFANTDKTKPRKGFARFVIRQNKPGKTTWKVSCTGGRNYSGKHTLTKVGPKKWRLALTRTFQVNKTETVKCALRSVTLNGKLLDTASRKYKVGPQIVNPGFGLKISGAVKLLDKKKLGKFKKRIVPVRFSIRANKPGMTSWKLKCSNGKAWAGKNLLKKVGKKKYRVGLTRKFKVTKTQVVKCSLRSITANKTLAHAKRKYVVKGKKPGLGVGDLVTKPNTGGKLPNKPIVVSIKPKCIGGRVFSTRKQPPQHICTCASSKKRVKLRKHVYKCVAKLAKKTPGKLVKKPKDLKKLKDLRRQKQLNAKNRAALRKAAQKRKRQLAIAKAKQRQAKLKALRQQQLKKRALQARPVTN
ncbi:MAG: hypothetical protein AAF441_16570 [Pseudomonadota bacterium]